MIDETLLWKRLIAQRENNIEHLDGGAHALYNAGINQAIGIMNSLPRIRCGTCKWHEGFTWICINGDSPNCAGVTMPGVYCPAWEPREETEDKKNE